MEWSGKFLIYIGVSHNVDHFPYQVADKIRKFQINIQVRAKNALIAVEMARQALGDCGDLS